MPLSPSAGGSSALSGVRATQTTNQTLSASTETALAFDGANDFDTAGYHSASVNNTRITIPSGKDGYYLIGGTVRLAVNSGTAMYAYIRKNGATVIPSLVSITAPTVVDAFGPTTLVHLVATDYVELMGFQNTAAGVATIASGCCFWAFLTGV